MCRKDERMDKVYRSKVDWWLWLVISVGIIVISVSSVALLVNPPQDDVPAVWIALAMLLLAAFMAWILFSVRYTVKCPQCGAEYDVTLFTFGRRIRCDCGEWVDLAVGHQQTSEDVEQASQQATIPRSMEQPIALSSFFRGWRSSWC
jgi:hypothetical protein